MQYKLAYTPGLMHRIGDQIRLDFVSYSDPDLIFFTDIYCCIDIRQMA